MHKSLLRESNEIVQELREYMERHNLSQNQLAKKSSLSQPQISRILRGESVRRHPSSKLVNLCNKIGIRTKNELFDPSEDSQLMLLLQRAIGENQNRMDLVKRVLKAMGEESHGAEH